MPVYEEKLISPFAVRFSQEHIKTVFRDGRLVEDSIAEIDCKAGDDESGYDLILKAPFPHIEITRWRPKGFEQDGEHWFTLDNRRLYCLQRAAAVHWPKTVAVVVQILYDDGGSMWKKFDSSSCGRSVSIAHRLKSVEISRWDWYQECTVNGAGTSMARAASVVLNDDGKVVVDDLVNATDESGSLMALARPLGAGQHQQDRSERKSKLTEPEVMRELARMFASTEEIQRASALRIEGSDASALCSTPSTTTEDTDGATEDSTSDNGASTIADFNAFGTNFNDISSYATYCGYAGYNGHSGFGGYGGCNSFGCGAYPYGFDPSMAMLNLHAQQAALHAHIAATQLLRFQALRSGPSQIPISYQRQAVPERSARGRTARSKASAQK